MSTKKTAAKKSATKAKDLAPKKGVKGAKKAVLFVRKAGRDSVD